MARISKSGITNGGTIDSTHLTRIIEALDGTGSADIYATGSFTGSFIGDGSQLTGIAGGGGTPGGSDTQIQYNNSNAFGGVPTLTYDGSVLRATGSFSGSFKGNLIGTSSWASNATTASIVSTYIGNDTGSLIKVNFGTRSSTATSSIGDLINVPAIAFDATYIVRTDIVGVWDGGYNIGGTLMAVYDNTLTYVGSITQIKNHNFIGVTPEFTYRRYSNGFPVTDYTLGVAVSGMSTGTVAWKAVTYITPVVYTP